MGVQGNLDPRVLTADKETIKIELEKYLPFGSREHKWIFNLGHGVLPNIPFDNVKFVVDWIKSVDWKR
jgi:uroporphyrinogen decarboxylase